MQSLHLMNFREKSSSFTIKDFVTLYCFFSFLHDVGFSGQRFSRVIFDLNLPGLKDCLVLVCNGYTCHEVKTGLYCYLHCSGWYWGFLVLLRICTKRYSLYSLYRLSKTFKISSSLFALEKNFELDL